MSDARSPERSPLETIVTDWSRFGAASIDAAARGALDSLPQAIAAVRRSQNLAAPAPMVAPLARVARLLAKAQAGTACDARSCAAGGEESNQSTRDLIASLEMARRRTNAALLAASGVLVEATAPRELLAVGDTLPVTVAVYNQGIEAVTLDSVAVSTSHRSSVPVPVGADVAPDSAARATVPLTASVAIGPPWLEIGRRGDVFVLPGAGSAASYSLAAGEDRTAASYARALIRIAGVPLSVDAGPVVYRFADPARGEHRKPLVVVPRISVHFENELQYARSGISLQRDIRVRVRSASTMPAAVTVTLGVPGGMTVDSLARRVALEPMAEAVLVFRVRGALAEGTHYINATATSGAGTFVRGWDVIGYDHIRPLHYFRTAALRLEAVDAALPKHTRIAYVNGVGDNVAPMLGQLGLSVTQIPAERVESTDLATYGAIVLGPRAFAASALLATQATRLLEFARAGGTVVVQYGQAEMQMPGLLPYPITLARTAQRVTDEHAPVRLLQPASRLLSFPNRIGARDFDGWVQERAVYMPTTADPRWQRLLEMHDPGETPNEHAILVAPLGKGAYVYTTLALFRQLPFGNHGAARLFLNLLAADGRDQAPRSPRP